MNEVLPKNIVLQFVVILYMEEYFNAHNVCIEALLYIETYSEIKFAHIPEFYRLGSVEEWFCSLSQECFILLPT